MQALPFTHATRDVVRWELLLWAGLAKELFRPFKELPVGGSQGAGRESGREAVKCVVV